MRGKASIMATILDPADLLCEYGDGRPAVAFGRWQYSRPGFVGVWRLHCRRHVKYDAIDARERELQVVYLHHHVDPAGSRGKGLSP